MTHLAFAEHQIDLMLRPRNVVREAKTYYIVYQPNQGLKKVKKKDLNRWRRWAARKDVDATLQPVI